MHEDVVPIYEQQTAIGYDVGPDRGRGRLPPVHAGAVPRLAGEAHHGGPAREARRLRREHAVDARPAAKAEALGVRWSRRSGGRVRARRRPARSRRWSPIRATIACDAVVVAAGPVGPRLLAHARPARQIDGQGPRRPAHYDRPMWTYWCLSRARSASTRRYLQTTTATSRRWSTWTPTRRCRRHGRVARDRRALGHLLQARLQLRRRAGRGAPWVVTARPTTWGSTPTGRTAPSTWWPRTSSGCGPRRSRTATSGSRASAGLPQGADRRDRGVHAGLVPGVRHVPPRTCTWSRTRTTATR